MDTHDADYEAIVIGTSAGGLAALSVLLRDLPKSYRIPILLVQHRAKDSLDLFEDVLQKRCSLIIRQAEEKEPISAGIVHVAPPDYHLLVEDNKTMSLSAEPPVQFSRPSIDVLFESAAVVYGRKLVAVILTGSNNDGAAGITAVSRLGGFTIAQDPGEARYAYMTQAAIDTRNVREVWPLVKIGEFLRSIG